MGEAPFSSFCIHVSGMKATIRYALLWKLIFKEDVLSDELSLKIYKQKLYDFQASWGSSIL